MTIAIGSTISAGILNKNAVFLPTIFGLLSLFLIQWLIAYLRRKFNFLNSSIDNRPLLLLRNGNFCKVNMSKANITKEDVIAKVREAGASNHLKIGAVIFETTGSISVIKDSDIHPEVLKNVIKEKL